MRITIAYARPQDDLRFEVLCGLYALLSAGIIVAAGLLAC